MEYFIIIAHIYHLLSKKKNQKGKSGKICQATDFTHPLASTNTTKLKIDQYRLELRQNKNDSIAPQKQYPNYYLVSVGL